jgi:hypothetical protein
VKTVGRTHVAMFFRGIYSFWLSLDQIDYFLTSTFESKMENIYDS